MCGVPIKVLVLSGPTGIGKTRIGCLLAKALGGEIISCDSVQVYRHMNVGSNKDYTVSPQHIIDVVDWDFPFSAHDYYGMCIKKIYEIDKRNKIPIVVGGSGFYMSWVLHGRPTGPKPSYKSLDDTYTSVDGSTWEESMKLLEKKDPEYAKTVGKNDFYRLQRALEILKVSGGKPLSSFLPDRSSHDAFDFRCFYLTRDRWSIYRSIDERCEAMIKSNLIGEVLDLKKKGFHKNCNSGRSIGYLQTLEFLEEIDRLCCESQIDDIHLVDKVISSYIRKFQTVSRNYSRNQDSWFARDKLFKWCDFRLFNNKDSDMVGFVINSFRYDLSGWKNDVLINHVHEKSIEQRNDHKKLESTMRRYKTELTLYNSLETRRAILDFCNKRV